MTAAPPRKLVTVELCIELVIDVPADWQQHEVEFFLNDGSHCLSNELSEIASVIDKYDGICMTCQRATGVYLHDATASEIHREHTLGRAVGLPMPETSEDAAAYLRRANLLCTCSNGRAQDHEPGCPLRTAYDHFTFWKRAKDV